MTRYYEPPSGEAMPALAPGGSISHKRTGDCFSRGALGTTPSP